MNPTISSENVKIKDGGSNKCNMGHNIYVNPNFHRPNILKVGEVHVNPRFLQQGMLSTSHISKNIHVNPKLVAAISENQERCRIDNQINVKLEVAEQQLALSKNVTAPIIRPLSEDPQNFVTKHKFVKGYSKNLRSCVSYADTNLKSNQVKHEPEVNNKEMHVLNSNFPGVPNEPSCSNQRFVFKSKTKIINAKISEPSRKETLFLNKNKLMKSPMKSRANHILVGPVFNSPSKLNNISKKRNSCFGKNLTFIRKPDSQFKYARNSVTYKTKTQKIAKILKDKYFDVRKFMKVNKHTSNTRQNKFKLDKRNKSSFEQGKSTNIYKVDKRRQSLTNSRYKLHRKPTLKPNTEHKYKTNNWHNICQKENQNMRVVRMNGVLYKTSFNKLTCTKTSVQDSNKKHSQVIYVRGEKFIMGRDGKSLRRHPAQKQNPSQHNVRRVDIEGVTYTAVSRNLLLRTNTHQARQIVTQAKQRSIALLSRRWKKNNIPCPVYHHLGRCCKHERGICMLVHDPKNIALCKRYLKGVCNGNNCLLSHSAIHSKVPTCHFYLEGTCTREDCPYLHVKVNKKAAICINFLQGYCAQGQMCKKRHIYKCPTYDKTRKCPKGKRCPYPHKSPRKKQKARVQPYIHQARETSETKVEKPVRYYMEPHESCVTSLLKQSDTIELPSYIPLPILPSDFHSPNL